jgi:hypothetical protein
LFVPSTMNTAVPIGHPMKADPLWKRWRLIYEQVSRTINGNVEFGNPTSGPVNILGVWKGVTTPSIANTDFTVTHNLGRTCVGVDVKTKNGACDVWVSPSVNPNPNTQIILRASVASITLSLFLH